MINKFLRWITLIFFSLVGLIVIVGTLSSLSLGDISDEIYAIYTILVLILSVVIWVFWVRWLYKALLKKDQKPTPDQALGVVVKQPDNFLQQGISHETNTNTSPVVETNSHTKKSNTSKRGAKKGGREWLWLGFMTIVIVVILNDDTTNELYLVESMESSADPAKLSVVSVLLVPFIITVIIHLLWPRHPIKAVDLNDNELSEPDIASTNNSHESLDHDYKEKLAIYEKLRQQIAVYDEKLSFIELGVYEPHFDFGDSEQYKAEITKVRAKQKTMVTSKQSCDYPDHMTLDGSLAKGKAMMNRQMRLTMRAFNNECEATIANTRWNNVVAMEKRILNSSKQINAANESLGLSITDEYISLKLEELYLTHEYREQQKVEKDERAERARQEREEKALLKAAEKAERKEAEQREALEKARAEAEAGTATDEMLQRIADLEKELEEAHAETERAQSMAQQTKSGYVYIISNVGAFGEEIVKIGLTRRLNPDDRVKELSDASVPFSFDTHAMIYSDDAPTLETALHREFSDRRVNMANSRKEFFRVSLDEVEIAVQKLAPEASFFKNREAQEWYETLARRNELFEENEDEFPASLAT